MTKKTTWILHLRIPHKSFKGAEELGQEMRKKFIVGYRIFTQNGNFDECESVTEKIDYENNEVKIHD